MDKTRIIICDENNQEAAGYAKICQGICDASNIPVELKIYSDINELKFDMGDEAFLALVNIMIVEPTGVFAEIPMFTRDKGYDGLMLFLSRSTATEHFLQGYDAEIYNYIIKGTETKTLERFHRIFTKSLEAAKQLERQYIVVSCSGEYKQIDVKTINYFEAADYMVIVNYGNQKFKFVSTLSSLEESLGDRGFVRVHRSYVVAIDAISRLSANERTDELFLNDGSRIPVSRSYVTSLKSAMDRWQL